MTDDVTTTSLTFENGYERLQLIAGRLNQEDVPVSEMCDLFAEGKGLEQALTDYLDEQRARVEAIQNGEGIRAFAITGQAVAEPAAAPRRSEFAPASPAQHDATDDEIPF
jgi:exodeoxyribonuclease VII small subunit